MGVWACGRVFFSHTPIPPHTHTMVKFTNLCTAQYYVSRYARVPFSNSYIPIPHTLPHRLRLTGDRLQVVVQAAPAGQDVLDRAMGGEEEMIDAYRIDEPGA